MTCTNKRIYIGVYALVFMYFISGDLFLITFPGSWQIFHRPHLIINVLSFGPLGVRMFMHNESGGLIST